VTQTPQTQIFLAKLEAIFGDAKLPTKEQVEREEAEERRASNLTRIKPAITVDDVDAIVHDRFGDRPALRATRLWYLTAKGKRQSKDGRPMRFLVLLGPPGRGKTVAASAVLAENGGYYISAPELHRLATSRSFAQRNRIEEMHTGSTVVIDDLGAEDADASMEAVVWDMVNARQTSGKLTVFTGNINRVEFEQRYGERATRRIEHQGAIVEIHDDDLRRRPL
jgi:hypothetical protein